MRHTLIVLLGLSLVQPASAASLHEKLENAWQNSPQAQTLEARRAESDAQSVSANSLLPAAPAVIIGHRSDQLNSNTGKREWEAGIALPIWLPGQRDARQRQALTGKTALEAGIRALHLKLAGELREAMWQVRLAESQLQLDQARAASARQLAEDVAKRVKAGELAKTDFNLAQNDSLSAQAAVLNSRSRYLLAQQSYATLTGSVSLPDNMLENAQSNPLPDDHPLLEEARQAIEVAQAQARVANESHRDNPELELSTRRERGNLNDPYASTVALTLRLPFATAARNQPLISAAQTELTRAQSEYNRIRLTLEYQRQQSDLALHNADQLLEMARQQQAAAHENLELIQKSFTLGESGLFPLLRARTAAFEADQLYNRQEISQALARARLNQALGVLP